MGKIQTSPPSVYISRKHEPLKNPPKLLFNTELPPLFTLEHLHIRATCFAIESPIPVFVASSLSMKPLTTLLISGEWWRTYDRLWNKERTAKWSKEQNNAPQRTERTPSINSSAEKEKEKEHSLKKKTRRPHVWAEVFRSTWWHFCTYSEVQKGRLFVTARNLKDHYC